MSLPSDRGLVAFDDLDAAGKTSLPGAVAAVGDRRGAAWALLGDVTVPGKAERTSSATGRPVCRCPDWGRTRSHRPGLLSGGGAAPSCRCAGLIVGVGLRSRAR
jgi:hypothetical protein